MYSTNKGNVNISHHKEHLEVQFTFAKLCLIYLLNLGGRVELDGLIIPTPEVYSKPCKTSKMERFSVFSRKTLNIR